MSQVVSPQKPATASQAAPARPGSTPAPVIGNYEIGKTIGKGSFGKVKLATFLPTGDKVAVKIINRQLLTNNTGMDAKIAREIKILKLFSHQNICRLYDVIATPADILVVMEYIPGKELYDVIVERGKLAEHDARYIFQQIICAVEYWHHYRVVHRDLKPENILLEPDLTVKVIDFGLANLMNDGVFLRTSCGSPNYAAPEVISGRLYVGPEIDVWSSGVILYALLCGCLPFDEETIPQLFKKIKAGEYRIPSHVTPDARDLLKRMLTTDPLERITVPQIRDHPWFLANLPRFLHYRPTLFDNAANIDATLIPRVATMTGTTPADVHLALERRADTDKPSKLQRSIQVTYKILVDAKRRKEIEDMKRMDKSETESVTTHGGGGSTAAARELNLGLMLSTSPAMNAMLDSGNAAKHREAYNNQSFVPASMHDARQISAGSMRINVMSPGANTFCFAGNPSSYSEKVGSLQHSLASVPRRDATAGAGGAFPSTYSGHTALPTALPSASASSSTTQLVGSVAKSGKVYDATEATIAVENNVGWRVGIMSERQSSALIVVLFQVLRELGFEWKSPSPFVIKARKRGFDTVLQLQPLRIAEKHEQGFVIDFQFIRGNTLNALEMAISITDKLVLRLG